MLLLSTAYFQQGYLFVGYFVFLDPLLLTPSDEDLLYGGLIREEPCQGPGQHFLSAQHKNLMVLRPQILLGHTRVLVDHDILGAQMLY